jgi:uncharacterized protein (DUF302 family)
MKLLNKIIISSILATSIFANPPVKIYSTQDNKAINYQTVFSTFKNFGYSVELISLIDKKFEKKYDDTNFDKFKIISLYNNYISKKLLEKNEHAGLFIPFSVILQSTKNNNNVTFSTIDVKTMQKTLNISDDKLFKKLEKKNDKVADLFGFDTKNQKEFNYNKKDTKIEIHKKEIKSSDTKSIEKNIISKLKENKFAIVNELNLTDKYKKINKKYDYYMTISFCDMNLLYELSKTRPESAVFCPCRLIIYKTKNSDKINLAFTSLTNLTTLFNIKDKQLIEKINHDQKLLENILNNL